MSSLKRRRGLKTENQKSVGLSISYSTEVPVAVEDSTPCLYAVSILTGPYFLMQTEYSIAYCRFWLILYVVDSHSAPNKRCTMTVFKTCK